MPATPFGTTGGAMFPNIGAETNATINDNEKITRLDIPEVVPNKPENNQTQIPETKMPVTGNLVQPTQTPTDPITSLATPATPVVVDLRSPTPIHRHNVSPNADSLTTLADEDEDTFISGVTNK